MENIKRKLEKFRDAHSLKGKGQLAVMLHITRLAKEKGLPIDLDGLRTGKEGQVAGLGKTRVQAILKDYGITRVLAEEGGRTSRGSLGNASDYSLFLNKLHQSGGVDLNSIEEWWVARVKGFFSSKPFTLKFDSSKSLSSIVSDLLAQAEKRQKDNPGTTYAGTVLQHLVGAKLDIILPEEKRVKHHGACVADSPTSRSGDFVLEGIAIHVTTTPGAALIGKCQKNINAGIRPVIVTTADGRFGAQSLAKVAGLEGRIDVIEAEQFIAANIMEWSHFAEGAQKIEIVKLLNAYNSIIDETETDPSLRIVY